MATPEQIRAALSSQIATAITDLHCYPSPPGTIVVPAAVIRRRDITYDVTMDGVDDSTYGVNVFVAFGNSEVAVIGLDAYLAPSGASSVVQAIHADPTLGGLVDFARVASAEGERVTNYAGIDYLSAELVVEIGD